MDSLKRPGRHLKGMRIGTCSGSCGVSWFSPDQYVVSPEGQSNPAKCIC